MPESCTLVLFGATGDLARQMIYKSLYHLTEKELLSPQFSMIGVGRTSHTNESFVTYIRDTLRQSLGEKYQAAVADRLLYHTRYIQGDVSDPLFYQQLYTQLHSASTPNHNIVFKLTIKPNLYTSVVEQLGRAGLHRSTGWVRVLIEKPFGQDLYSSQKLDQAFKQYFSDDQVFRIDHYLTKETVQNILAFRFGNGLLEPIWNRDFIDHIQISMLETLTVGSRGSFYEQTGALRDVLQNHLLQLLALTCMDIPENFSAAALQRKREEILSNLKPLSPQEVAQFTVRGQYANYRQEKDVDPSSQVETFVALRAELETNRWQGVPIYIRSGKALHTKATEISIVFKQHIESIFSEMEGYVPQANILTIRIAPNEGIALKLLAKKPGHRLSLTPVTMHFSYSDLHETLMQPYEKILLDAFNGDQTLFTSTKEVEHQWQFVDPILAAWQTNSLELLSYEQGSLGPQEADLMMEREGKHWISPNL